MGGGGEEGEKESVLAWVVFASFFLSSAPERHLGGLGRASLQDWCAPRPSWPSRLHGGEGRVNHRRDPEHQRALDRLPPTDLKRSRQCRTAVSDWGTCGAAREEGPSPGRVAWNHLHTGAAPWEVPPLTLLDQFELVAGDNWFGWPCDAKPRNCAAPIFARPDEAPAPGRTRPLQPHVGGCCRISSVRPICPALGVALQFHVVLRPISLFLEYRTN